MILLNMAPAKYLHNGQLISWIFRPWTRRCSTSVCACYKSVMINSFHVWLFDAELAGPVQGAKEAD